jgi:hypothetical protein
VQADQPGGAIGGAAGQPRAGLADHLAGASDGGLWVVHQPGQLPAGLAAGASKRAAGVTGHPGGVSAGLLGHGGQLGGPLDDLLGGLVGAGAQRAGQLVRSAMGGTAAVPDPGTGRAAGGPDALDRGLKLADGAASSPASVG